MRDFSFTIESLINCEKERLWQHLTQMKNVNAELMPWIRMTYPADRGEIGKQAVPLNQRLFTSVLLLFGFMPIDLHYLRFEKLDMGNAFYENSSSLLQKYWKHARTLSAQGNKTLVRDELHFQPRVPFAGHIVLPLVKTVFRNRHAQLTKSFI